MNTYPKSGIDRWFVTGLVVHTSLVTALFLSAIF